MQQQMGLVEEELRRTKEQLNLTEVELYLKDKKMESLKSELLKAKQSEKRVAEKDATLDRLKEELTDLKASETCAVSLLSESQKRIHEIEDEVEDRKVSESKIFDSLATQTKLLEQSKIELEESKLEIASLGEKMQVLIRERRHDLDGFLSDDSSDSMDDELEDLKSVLRHMKQELLQAQEDEKIATLKFKSLKDEIALLKEEANLASDEEEKSKKAMDDLALALKEVVTEAKLAKDEHNATKEELRQLKERSERMKRFGGAEGEQMELLKEARRETQVYKNTADRLRLEAEESQLAWNGKEKGFVNCIKRGDEERAAVEHENMKLKAALKATENTARAAREENYKLREILKQAMNEASDAKEAASLAQDENSRLKDYISEKDENVDFLTQQNEYLRVNEAAARENAKEMKRLLSTVSRDSKSEDNGQETSSTDSMMEKYKEGKSYMKGFSLDLGVLKFLNEDFENDKDVLLHEDPEKAEALKGSIFDTTVSPKSEPHTPKVVTASHHHPQRWSFTFTHSAREPKMDDFGHLDETDHSDDLSSFRHSHRKSRTPFRRFSDIIAVPKSFRRKHSSTEGSKEVVY